MYSQSAFCRPLIFPFRITNNLKTVSLLALSLLASGESFPISDFQWESGGTVFLRLMAVFGLILINAFFVASEFAIIKIRTSTLDNLIEKGNARAGVARLITRDLEAYLSATQFGITLSSLGLGWVGEPFVARLIVPFLHLLGIHSAVLLHSISFVIAFSLITYFEILLGELVPKSLAIRKPVFMALWLSPPLRTFYLIFRPFINFLNYSEISFFSMCSGSNLPRSRSKLFLMRNSDMSCWKVDRRQPLRNLDENSP